MPDAWQIKIRRWQLSNDYLPEVPSNFVEQVISGTY